MVNGYGAKQKAESGKRKERGAGRWEMGDGSDEKGKSAVPPSLKLRRDEKLRRAKEDRSQKSATTGQKADESFARRMREEAGNQELGGRSPRRLRPLAKRSASGPEGAYAPVGGRGRLFGQFRNILIFIFLDENAEHVPERRKRMVTLPLVHP
jgi:hypothetical protein